MTKTLIKGSQIRKADFIKSEASGEVDWNNDADTASMKAIASLVSDAEDKNHTVISKNLIVTDQQGKKIHDYTVRCDLNGEQLKIADMSEFAPSSIAFGEKNFVWAKSSGETGRYMGIGSFRSTSCKYVFKLDINDSTDNKIKTHLFGLLVDTPPDSTFTFVTTCEWNIVVKVDSSNRLFAFMQIPDDFVGTVVLTPMRSSLSIGAFFQNPSSFDYETGTTTPHYYSWISSTGTVSLNTITEFVGSDVQTGGSSNSTTYIREPFGKYNVNVIGDFGGNLAVNSKIPDAIVNDYFLHTLERRIDFVREENANVQSDWNQTDNTADDFIKNKPTIPAAQIQSDWNQSDNTQKDFIKNKPDLDATLYESLTYSQLVTKINNSQLVKGRKYRITDYVTTTTQSNTSSAGHAFDLVVTAIDVNKLDCKASALLHSGDTYFSTAGADLSKWQIWYDVNNDTTKYAWADSTNGKGVIYRMIDEWDNDCPYDFKNILFTKSGTYTSVYTFNKFFKGDTANSDYSLNGTICYGNVIKPYVQTNKLTLNFNVFLNTQQNSNCFYNVFNDGCYSNVFGGYCNDNVLGTSCHSNSFGDYINGNRFGSSCVSNSFGGDVSYNIIGSNFSNNDIGSGEFYRNTFGYGCTNNSFANMFEGNVCSDFCHHNNFSSECAGNEMGSQCHHISLSACCSYNTIGSGCKYIQFNNSSDEGGLYSSYNIIENGNSYIRLYNTTSPSASKLLRNVYIAQGCSGTASAYTEISTIARNLSYRTTVGRDSSGNIRIYNEDDPASASQAQANWNETSSSSPSYIQNKPTLTTVTFRHW